MEVKDTVHLEVLTPENKVIDLEVKFVAAPSVEGEFGVYPGHAEMFTLLKAGEVTYEYGGNRYYAAVSSGYAHVDSSTVSILVGNAEKAEDIDLERATKDRDKWEMELAGVGLEDKNVPLYKERLERAQARVDVASRLVKK